MYLHVDEKMSDNIEVFNLETGQMLDRCKWADDTKGEYLEFIGIKNNGTEYKLKKANIKLVYSPLNER